ncbi:RNA polymerase sigma-70 factor (ECF subfamily) [Chitinophaga polysaccharea]|uniref:RNA polymerase sigma factor n=1 Tax=Chitinophaga polysaccharea TaxID=1293035 RepID=A0A561PGZ7_9BACT|nr:sigma-70 family RNA polymerase sigma factor [Chitinophaga polysaccharea]TWF37340.1 RNA polymerase sigma-70 factor (ECF subfamily) [Chitinophaga polysaccharea]
MQDLTDGVLLQRLSEGDEQAFTLLFKRYSHKIYTIGLKLMKSAPMAEELVQEVFLQVWQKRVDMQRVVSFRAYLFTITRNQAIDYLRHIRRQELREQAGGALLEALGQDVGDWLAEKEYAIVIHQAVDRLSIRQKQVYHLMKGEGYKRRETAEILRMSPETVKSHLAEAMRAIRQYCQAYLKFLPLLLAFFRS